MSSFHNNPRKKISLSLINMWEFTITIETLDYGGSGTYSAYNPGYGAHYGGEGGYGSRYEAIAGLRAQIKKISRVHVGRDGRHGAVFERGGADDAAILPDDPLLRNAAAETAARDDGATAGGGSGGADAGAGRWRIPLGAYHPLMTFLTSGAGGASYSVEGIPPEQLRAATLGRERMDKKTYATVGDLVRRNVSPVVATALAPYQRGGVEFMLDKEGRALLADEMGLGKTVQAIAAMSAYRERDWPLLVLCPSTARYHWETEFRCWMGSDARKKAEEASSDKGGGNIVTASTNFKDNNAKYLKNSQINVLTSGRCPILSYVNGAPTTRVVICSIGLIVNLATSKRILPGLFKAIIVDESHALKSKNTKRTKAVLPLLKAAERCLLLSGTPAFAKPSELWPQLSVLGSRSKRRHDSGGSDSGGSEKSTGIWCGETEFMAKYVKPKGEDSNKTKLAELHTMLTSTVMIRRMKADILKNLPSKVREKAYVKIQDKTLANEFRTYMGLLRQGKGVLGKLARTHHHQQQQQQPATDEAAGKTDDAAEETHGEVTAGENGVRRNKEVLHHLYNLTGRSKIKRVTKMLVSWLADPTKGKLCIFAHHLDVLNNVTAGAKLDNSIRSKTKFIRIDGSTNPKQRQEQILQFQTDPSVRIAMLGITAAGVAVTLTASSTVWFAELFWTPAIMIQAEDRCHRIGQQARVRCLYFIGRGTLDEVLWKLIEKKFRDLGEFIEGKEKMGIALERELEDDEEEEILKTEDGDGDGEDDDNVGSKRKRKAVQDVFSDLFDPEDLENDIQDMCQEEIDMLKSKNAEEEELETDPAAADNNKGEAEATDNDKVAKTGEDGDAKQRPGSSAENIIELLDDDADEQGKNKPRMTIKHIRELYRASGILARLKIDPLVQFDNLRAYTVEYPGPAYGLIMVACNGRVVVKAHHSSVASPMTNNNGETKIPKIGSIIVGVNGYLIPYTAAFVKVLQLMKHMMRNPPVTVTFAEDDDFTSMFVEDFIPNLPVRRVQMTGGAVLSPSPSSTVMTALAPSSSAGNSVNSTKVIELLDDD